MPSLEDQANRFLAGEELAFNEVNALWQALKRTGELSLARAMLERVRDGEGLLDGLPKNRKDKERLCQQEALLISKDPEINSAVRHDLAIETLGEEFDLDDPGLDGDAETLGIAGGILKRRWQELGQLGDLKQAAEYYRRGAVGDDLGDDAYAHINAAFLEDLLAEAGDEPDERRRRARDLRKRILRDLPVKPDNWFNVATRAEAYVGLGLFEEATAALRTTTRPAPWKLETTARQLATLAHIREEKPMEKQAVRRLFETLLGGSAEATRSALVGRVGLALSGGGFRASFYHLGVLARLAELDVLRNVEVLSCVSGGSIVGACYWLALRKQLENTETAGQVDYIELVRFLIDHFERAVAADLRDQVQLSTLRTVWQMLRGAKGAMDPQKTASALEKHFYRPLLPGDGPLFMHDLAFNPADHNPATAGSTVFNPTKHNWLRAHKVPVLVLNATTVNTGHAWQFTPHWMGESPWSVHEAADSVPRLQWSWYEPKAGWQMSLAQAVAASACVPGVFAPLRIENAYEDIIVQLVDGGVYDNQGTASLLAQSCNVILVSDAAGQLKLESKPGEGLEGLAAYAKRSMDTLMERIRQANFGDLSARLRTGLLRGLLFLHMKSGLDADAIPLPFSHEATQVKRSLLSPYGVRKDFQKALAELRTDLDAFTLDESRTLMACGYQMAKKAFQRDLSQLTGLSNDSVAADWPFKPELKEITSTAAATDRRAELLNTLRKGSRVTI